MGSPWLESRSISIRFHPASTWCPRPRPTRRSRNPALPRPTTSTTITWRGPPSPTPGAKPCFTMSPREHTARRPTRKAPAQGMSVLPLQPARPRASRCACTTITTRISPLVPGPVMPPSCHPSNRRCKSSRSFPRHGIRPRSPLKRIDHLGLVGGHPPRERVIVVVCYAHFTRYTDRSRGYRRRLKSRSFQQGRLGRQTRPEP